MPPEEITRRLLDIAGLTARQARVQRIEWAVARLDGVSVYVDGTNVIVTRGDLQPMTPVQAVIAAQIAAAANIRDDRACSTDAPRRRPTPSVRPRAIDEGQAITFMLTTDGLPAGHRCRIGSQGSAAAAGCRRGHGRLSTVGADGAAALVGADAAGPGDRG